MERSRAAGVISSERQVSAFSYYKRYTPSTVKRESQQIHVFELDSARSRSTRCTTSVSSFFSFFSLCLSVPVDPALTELFRSVQVKNTLKIQRCSTLLWLASTRTHPQINKTDELSDSELGENQTSPSGQAEILQFDLGSTLSFHQSFPVESPTSLCSSHSLSSLYYWVGRSGRYKWYPVSSWAFHTRSTQMTSIWFPPPPQFSLMLRNKLNCGGEKKRRKRRWKEENKSLSQITSTIS